MVDLDGLLYEADTALLGAKRGARGATAAVSRSRLGLEVTAHITSDVTADFIADITEVAARDRS